MATVAQKRKDGIGNEFWFSIIPAVGGGFRILQERERNYKSRLSFRTFLTEAKAWRAFEAGAVGYGSWE